MNSLQAEMAGSPETAAILEALNAQRADARERQSAMERQIRDEARRLQQGGAAGQPLASDVGLPACEAGLTLFQRAAFRRWLPPVG